MQLFNEYTLMPGVTRVHLVMNGGHVGYLCMTELLWTCILAEMSNDAGGIRSTETIIRNRRASSSGAIQEEPQDAEDGQKNIA